MLCLNLQSNDQHPSLFLIITFVIIEAVMAVQPSFESGGRLGGCDVIFNITEGGG